MSDAPILNLPTGLRFRAGGGIAQLDALAASAGQWLAITPESEAHTDEPAPPLAKLLATLGGPIGGTVELFGQPLTSLPYVDLQHVRTRLGFVVNRGGLLSNRTIAENIALPLSVHANLSADDESGRVTQLLSDFDLTRVAARRPDAVDGAARFRACVARALALKPEWIVVEGVGDFGQPQSRTWDRLHAYRDSNASALAVCLNAPDPRYEEWFAAQGGRVIRYRYLPEAA